MDKVLFLLDPEVVLSLQNLEKPVKGIPLVNVPLNENKTQKSIRWREASLKVLGVLPPEDRSMVVEVKAKDKENIEVALQGGVNVVGVTVIIISWAESFAFCVLSTSGIVDVFQRLLSLQ